MILFFVFLFFVLVLVVVVAAVGVVAAAGRGGGGGGGGGGGSVGAVCALALGVGGVGAAAAVVIVVLSMLYLQRNIIYWPCSSKVPNPHADFERQYLQLAAGFPVIKRMHSQSSFLLPGFLSLNRGQFDLRFGSRLEITEKCHHVAISRKEILKIPRFADFWRAFYSVRFAISHKFQLNLVCGEEKCHLWQRFKKLLKRQAPMISFRSWKRNTIPWLATCTFRRVVGENSRLKTISVWNCRGQRCLFF